MNECVLEKPLAGRQGPIFCGYPSQIQTSGHPQVIPSASLHVCKGLGKQELLSINNSRQGKSWDPERYSLKSQMSGRKMLLYKTVVPIFLIPQLSWASHTSFQYKRQTDTHMNIPQAMVHKYNQQHLYSSIKDQLFLCYSQFKQTKWSHRNE